MSETDVLAELMLEWESRRQRGDVVAVRDLCADRPDLADEVAKRIEVIERMEILMGVRAPHCDSTWILREEASDADTLPVSFPKTIPGYELLNVVGRGGMGVVYKARDLKLGRTVAVKMLHGAALPKQLKRFQNEATLIAKLKHTNIVEIYGFGEHEGIPFFSMELVEPGNLLDSLEERQPAIDETVALVETLARTVQFAHDNGVIHRDLKPANILLRNADSGLRNERAEFQSAIRNLKSAIPKISDFGLAKHLEDESGHTRTGEVLGTLAYMAPEQLEHDAGAVDHRVDVYALGTILYEMLTGRPPFEGTPAVIMRRLLSDDPIAPSKSRPEISRDLDAICLKCLEKSRNDRYATPADLANDLKRLRQGEPVTARRVGPASRTWKWIKRRPQFAIPTALIVCFIAAIPIVQAIRHSQAQAELRREAVQFAPQAAEILRRNCYECHGSDPVLMQRKLNVLDHDLLLDGKRRLVVAGAPDDSRLLQRITDGSMPPEKEETVLPRLCQTEVAILRTWIAGGAPPFPAEVASNPTPPVVEYSALAAEVKQIFIDRCYKCHKYDVAKGGIKILHHRLLVNERKVVVPGQSQESELYQLISQKDVEAAMPPPKQPPLTAEQIETIKKWIDEGAAPFPKSP